MKHAIALLSALFASAVVMSAQQVVTLSTPGGVVTSGYVTLESKTLKGAPYSAEMVNDSTQVLADGNRIVRHTTGRVYRDNEGRVRREEDGTVGEIGPNRPMILPGPSISIVDPVAGVSYTLDPESHVAWKTASKVGPVLMENVLRRRAEEVATQAKALQLKMESGAVLATADGWRGGEANRKNVEESLAPRQIEGVLAEGHRNTTTIPAGAIGNEQPITIVSEEWTSQDLGVLVMTDHKDPRTGESSYRLVNIIRGEPDASLFQVPPDYTVKETGIRRLEPTRQER